MNITFPTYGFHEIQHLPITDEYQFQKLVTSFFNNKYDTDSFDEFGSRGDAQYGIDVLSAEMQIAVQCKCYDISKNQTKAVSRLLEKIKGDFDAFKEYNKSHGNIFKKYIIASSLRNNTKILELCLSLRDNSIEVIYYSWDKILSEMPPHLKKIVFENDYKLAKEYYCSSAKDLILAELQINDQDPIIEKIYSFLSSATKTLSFVFPEILSNCSSFYNKDGDFHYTNFALHITNSQSYYDLKSITFDKNIKKYCIPKRISKTVANTQNKVRFIFETLYNSLIYRIYLSDKEFFDIPCDNTQMTRSILFIYESCDFIKLTKQLTIHPNDNSKVLLEKAYFLFRIRSYNNSFKALQLALKNSSFNEDQRFIINFNLVELSKIPELKYFSKPEIAAEIKKVEKADLQNQYFCLSSLNKLLFESYINTNFYNRPLQRISELTKKIRFCLESSITSRGTNNNQYANDLIFAFAQFDYSLTRNNIVFDVFSEFDNIVDHFTEGVLASLSITSNRHSHLINLQEYVLIRILLYCRFDSLKQIFAVYKISKIKYAEFGKKDAGIITIIRNLFDNFKLFTEKNTSKGTKYSDFFDEYIELMKKGIFLASRLELSNSQCNTISTILLNFLDDIDFINYELGRQIAGFFTLNSKLLDSSKYKRLCRAVFINKALHSEGIFEYIIEALDKKGVKLNSHDSKKLLNCFFGPCIICNDNHNIEILLSNFNILCFEEQKRLTHRYSANHKELSFNEHFLALYHGVFNDPGSFISKAITTIKNDIKTPQKNFLFFDIRADRRKSIDWFIWVCFKYNISLNDDKFIFIRDFDTYYYWLCDMDGFDYSQFEPIWICEFSSGMHSGYYKRIKSCPNALNAIKLYLENNNDLRVEHVYMKILKIG